MCHIHNANDDDDDESTFPKGKFDECLVKAAKAVFKILLFHTTPFFKMMISIGECMIFNNCIAECNKIVNITFCWKTRIIVSLEMIFIILVK